MVVRLVKAERQELPRSGCRKMLELIRPLMEEHEIKLGRDQLFALLREEDMLIRPRKKCPKTTYSRHGYAVQPNRFSELDLTAPGQAIVADITYIRVGERFKYLYLLTDAFSRMIVGWELSHSLSHGAAISAIKKAVKVMVNPSGALHHSDRGCQYCCHDFLKELSNYGIVSSMTDADHCAQNALAERMNGILKDEFYLDLTFSSLRQARQAIHNAVELYNWRRPHLSLKYKTPAAVHFAWQQLQEAA